MTYLETLTRWLDDLGCGSGPVTLASVGAGQSNPTFLAQRGSDRWVLRRPPAGELVPGTHDVLREASWMSALGDNGVPVPRILGTCQTDGPLGHPAILMSFVEGFVADAGLPAELEAPGRRRAMVEVFVESLVALHSVDAEAPGLAPYRRPGDFVDRQLSRFAKLWPLNKTREMPAVEELHAWLLARRPLLRSQPTTVVHGDARPGNVMFGLEDERLVVRAVLDWEMAALGDPLADVGYVLATWSEPADLAADDPLAHVSAWTAEQGYPDRREIALRYAELSGRPTDQVGYYEALALWKALVIMEGNYGRFVKDPAGMAPIIATYGEGLPVLAQRGLQVAASFDVLQATVS